MLTQNYVYIKKNQTFQNYLEYIVYSKVRTLTQKVGKFSTPMSNLASCILQCIFDYRYTDLFFDKSGRFALISLSSNYHYL